MSRRRILLYVSLGIVCVAALLIDWGVAGRTGIRDADPFVVQHDSWCVMLDSGYLSVNRHTTSDAYPDENLRSTGREATTRRINMANKGWRWQVVGSSDYIGEPSRHLLGLVLTRSGDLVSSELNVYSATTKITEKGLSIHVLILIGVPALLILLIRKWRRRQA